MTKKFCDRCGKLIPSVCVLTQTTFPLFSIRETIGIGHSFEIDLCQACMRDFESWFMQPREGENDD